MKKIYSLFILCCLSLVGIAQTTTVTVNCAGLTGSYQSGYAFNETTPTRNDGSIKVNYVAVATATTGEKRGYAVFNLAGIVPTGAVVTSVSLRFNIISITGTTAPATAIYGYAGDLSTVTSAATLFTDCMTGTAFNTTPWGTAATTLTLPLNATGVSFIGTAASTASPVSLCFRSSSITTATYTITGETGVAALQPQLQISYTCPGLTGVSASYTPSSVCAGSTFTLAGNDTGGVSYSWTGPAGFSSTQLSPTNIFTASTTTAGIYTLSVSNGSSCNTVVTTNVVVNPLPNPIGGASSICIGLSSTMTESLGGGTWSISPSSVATINSSGMVTGISSGTAIVTNTSTAGCSITKVVGVGAPGPINGTALICIGQPVTFTDSIPGGTWASSASLIASVSTTGVVTGGSPGTATISYTNVCGAPVTLGVTVSAMNTGAITGASSVCQGGSTTLSDTTTGGHWSSATSSIATVNSTTGSVSGVTPGVVTITYTDIHNCYRTSSMTVNPVPTAIMGTLNTCIGVSTTLTDAITGGHWRYVVSGSHISADSVTGMVTGLTAGTTTITYANACGIVTAPVVVAVPPPAITGTLATCPGATVTLSDASSGGLWSSSDTTIAHAGAYFGSVTGVTAGSLIITYTATSGCIATTIFFVNPGPAPITGTFHICPGSSVLIADTSAHGLWSSSDPFIASIDTFGIVHGVSASTTTITYTLPSTGCFTTISFLVNPNPATISGNTVFCAGAADTLTDISPGGSWSCNNTSLATISTPWGGVTTVAAGSPVITYTLPTGCYITRSLLIHPLPTPVIVYNGGTNTFTVGSYYTSYQWSENGSNIPGAVTNHLAGTVNAVYNVTVTDTFGCVNTAVPDTLVNVEVSNIAAAGNIHIVPNPSSGIFHIESMANVKAVVSGIDGKVVMTQINAKDIDLTNLSNGIYFIALFDDAGNKLLVDKLIKQ